MNTISLIEMRNAFDNEMCSSAESLIDADIHSMADTESNDALVSQYDTGSLIDYIIKRHHDFAKKNTIVIYGLMQKVTYRPDGQRPELKKFVELAFCFFQDLLNQMLKEEQSFFPYMMQTIKARKHNSKSHIYSCETLEEKIKLQKAEHANSLNYLKVFREITNDYQLPPDACRHNKSLFKKMKELERDLTRHFHLEDNILSESILAGNELVRRQQI